MRYLKPLHSVLAKSALLKKFLQEEGAGHDASAASQNSSTHVERKEELKLLISFDDSKWISATLWQHFFTLIQQQECTTSSENGRRDGMHSPDDIQAIVERLSPALLAEKQHVLEESVLYARVAALMVEADL